MPSFNVEQGVPPLERVVGSTPQRESTWQPPRTLPAQQPAIESLKVSTRSRPSAVAGAIAGVMRERGEVEVQTIGAGATNQAIKAIAISRAYLVDDGIDVCVVPSFIDLVVDGQERTALRLFVQRRPH